MKRKLLSVAIAVTLMLSLAACGGSSADESSSGGNTAAGTVESAAENGDSEVSDEEEISEDVEEEDAEVSADSEESDTSENDDYYDADLAPNTDVVYTLEYNSSVTSYSFSVNIAVPAGHIYDEENSQPTNLYFYSNTDENNEGNTWVIYEFWEGRTEEDMENLYSGKYQYMEEDDAWDVTVDDMKTMTVSGREVHYIIACYTYKEEGLEYNEIEYYAWTFLTDTMPIEVNATETYYGSEPEVYTDEKALLKALFLAIQD